MQSSSTARRTSPLPASPRWPSTLGLLLGGALLGGCAVPVHQQRLVSKPAMQFSDSPVFQYQSRLIAQVEPGAASSGGAQAAGCTSCR